MLRLNFYNQYKDFVINTKTNDINLYSKKEILEIKKNIDKYDWFSVNYKKEFEDFINSKTSVKNYLAFVNTIRNETAKKIPGMFLNILEDGVLYVLVNRFYNSNFEFICKYEIEDEKMLEFVKKLFRFTDEKNFAYINSSFENHFSYICPWQILKILFTKADIENSGEELYTSFKKPKKSGGMREIIAPHEKIKKALCDLNFMLQKVYDGRNADFQIAYKKGKNVKTGAMIHKDKKYVFNIDLSDFYPSCKKEIVKKYTDFLFAFSFNREFIEEEFFNVIFINDGLFIGSPISGTLANVTISNAVLYMKNICKKYDMGLSVYADDITFSSDKFIVKDFIVKLFNEAFTKYGLDQYYTLNEKKCIGFSGCNRKVTGVTINNDNKVTVPRRYYRDLRVQINHLANGDMGININILRGKIAYASMLDESGKIYNYLMKYKDTVEKYNLCSDEKLEELKKRAGK